MTARECRRLGEYPTIVRWAMAYGCYATLRRAHETPITQREAVRLIYAFRRQPIDIAFRGKRGRASQPNANMERRTAEYRITLPPEPGRCWGNLRVGIVLHELAHVIDHERRRSTAGWPSKVRHNHGAGFRNRFAELLKAWAAAAQTATHGATDEPTITSPAQAPDALTRRSTASPDRGAAARKAWATRRRAAGTYRGTHNG
jgi:hypothetical protein